MTMRELQFDFLAFLSTSRRKELEREVLDIAADEQRRIGQELHDDVGQELTRLSR